MRANVLTTIAVLLWPTVVVGADNRVGDWAAGVGLKFCKDIKRIPDTELVPWVSGYWTGANLYLGSTDLCEERAAISQMSASAVRALLDAQCRLIEDQKIMVAAFNALKSIPKIPGSRAAACGGQ